MSVLWKHLGSQQNNKLRVMFWRTLEYSGSIQDVHEIFSPKIMLNAVPVTGCAIVETAGLSKAIEWTLWQSQAITSMQAEVEEQEWMHSPGEGQGLRVVLALVQHGLAMNGRTYGRSTLFFRIEQYLDPLLMLLLLHPNQKTCRISEIPKVILIPFFPPGFPSLCLFKIPMWIFKCFLKLIFIGV